MNRQIRFNPNLSTSIESSLPPAPCPAPKPREEGDGRSTRSSRAWSSISDWKKSRMLVLGKRMLHLKEKNDVAH